MTNLEQLSPLECLRRDRHQVWLRQLQVEVSQCLLPNCAIYLFGSRARGDWDGYSDTDLLVVGISQTIAEAQADKLREDLVGDDVIAVTSAYWRAINGESSPYWRAIKEYAQLLAGEIK
jgi:predicted nucleotidyltransferase